MLRSLHPLPFERTFELNDPEASEKFNIARIQNAEKEIQNPIWNIFTSVKNAIKNTLKGTVKFATDIVTNAIAIPANFGRWTTDVALKIPSRAMIATSDLVSENTFGRISRLCRSVKEKIYNIFGVEEENAEENGHGSHGGHGGHGGSVFHPVHKHAHTH